MVPSNRSGRVRLVLIASLLAVLLAGGLIFADWWTVLPKDVQFKYVGRSSCMQCHMEQARSWRGSHHDLAMDVASEETVLADFDDQQLSHFGVTSRMYRDGSKYMIRTEGPEGEKADFEIKYVFGVHPLQQYMVEFDAPESSDPNTVGRLQVLRVSWDSEKNEWFYLPAPDVSEKLAPDDPLHWTGPAQNWNHMCAECHSTNLRKNFDVATKRFHTTFSEIDVSCEACHGPGSVHVDLASGNSLFWDRRLGYGLAKLKSDDSHVQIETCARCHARRDARYPNYRPGTPFYDCYANRYIEEGLYYPDGQIRDEVYVYGSFIQSKMYHKGVRCTDCHNPHSATLKHQGNQLCVSCHAHDEAIYDSVSHHRHATGSEGARCVECHMPETHYMEVDPRRDHGFKIPRPDHSIALGTPNACVRCHIHRERLEPSMRQRLPRYSDWLEAARLGDEAAAAELERLNQWALYSMKRWGVSFAKFESRDFASTLSRAWSMDQDAIPDLTRLAKDKMMPGIIRASALAALVPFSSAGALPVATTAAKDPDPQVRLAAIPYLEQLPRKELLRNLTPLLNDAARVVRMDAGRALASLPREALNRDQFAARDRALRDYRRGLLAHADQAAAHLGLGLLAERQRDFTSAADAYRTAIRVQPKVTGPRSNLAALLEQSGRDQQAARWRRQELDLLARDARLAPESASIQYRYGLSLYLHDRMEEAEVAIRRAHELEPRVPDFLLGLTLILQRQQKWDEALSRARQLVELRPNDPSYQKLLREILTRTPQIDTGD